MDDVTRPNDDGGKSMVSASGAAEGKAAGDDTANLTDYFRVILKHRQMIFRICAVTVVFTAIVSLLLPKKFSATTTVVPPMDVLQREAGMAAGLGSVKSDLLRKAMDVGSIADMYIGILKSRSIADAIIERFDLAKVYGIKNDVAAVRQTLGERTNIRVTDEGIVTVTVEDRDRNRVADLANAYVEELDRQNKRLFVGQAASKKVFLENRLREIQAELSNIDNIPSREARIKEMLFELLTREFEVAKIEEAKSMPTIQVLDKAVVPEKKCKPRRTQMVVLAGVTSLLVAVFVAFIREHLTRFSPGGMRS